MLLLLPSHSAPSALRYRSTHLKLSPRLHIGIMYFWGSFICAFLIVVVDYCTILSVILCREVTIFGHRIPYVSFLIALVLSELPVWISVLSKIVLFCGATYIHQEYYFVLASFSMTTSMLHALVYLKNAIDAKKVADLTVERFSEAGPLSLSTDAHKNVENPIKLALIDCMFPSLHHSSYGLEAFKDICYATEEEKKEAGSEVHLLTLNIYRLKQQPQPERLKPVVVYTHGGAWTEGFGSKDTRVPFLYHSAARGK